jgi:hypothetical protein
MMRRRIHLALVGAAALVVGFGLHAAWSTARADLPQSTATQIYQPDFQEWAFVYLNACYRDFSSGSHFVSVGRETINGRVHFKIAGTYTNTPAGKAWFDRIGSKIRGNVEKDCRRWTQYGFAIGLNDVEVTVAVGG